LKVSVIGFLVFPVADNYFGLRPSISLVS